RLEAIEAPVPCRSMGFYPASDVIHAIGPDSALADPPRFLRGHEPRLLQDPYVFEHARQRDAGSSGEVGDRRGSEPEVLEDVPTGSVRERCERAIHDLRLN